MSEHEDTIDGHDAARIVMTLRNVANMMVIQADHPARPVAREPATVVTAAGPGSSEARA